MSSGIEALLQQVQTLGDPRAREAALGLARGILDLHAAALERMLELIAETADGTALIDRIAADAQAGGVLLLHDLHPLDFITRVQRVLDRPDFHRHGAAVELISIRDGIVHIRIEGVQALRAAVEAALWEAAPDAQELVIDGADQSGAAGFVPIERLLAG